MCASSLEFVNTITRRVNTKEKPGVQSVPVHVFSMIEEFRRQAIVLCS